MIKRLFQLTLVLSILVFSSFSAAVPYESMWQNTIQDYSSSKRSGVKKHQVIYYKKLASSQSFFALTNRLRHINVNKLKDDEKIVFFINSFNIAVVQHYLHHRKELDFKQRIPFLSNAFTYLDIINYLRKRNVLYLLCLSDANVNSPQLKAYTAANFQSEFKAQIDDYSDHSIRLLEKDRMIKINHWYKKMKFTKRDLVVTLLNLDPKIPYKVRYNPASSHINRRHK